MASGDSKSSVSAAVIGGVIGGIFLIVSTVISGIFLLQSSKLRSESAATATAVSLITQVPLPTYTPPAPLPTYTPQPPLPTYTPPATYTPRPTFTLVPTATAIPVSPTPSVSLPFSDNFDNGVGRMWLSSGGDWEMANGRLVNRGSDGVIWLGKTDWTNVAIEVETMPNSCNRLVQILVRVQDPQNYIAVRRWNGNSCWDTDNALYLIKDGEQKKKMVDRLPEGTQLKIEVIGNVYKVYVDGKLAGSATDETFTSGSVGFTMNDSGYVDNFSVTALGD